MIVFSDNGFRTFKIWKFELKTSKTKVVNLPFFKQINTENRIANCHCIPFLMRYDSELFSDVSVCIILFIK